MQNWEKREPLHAYGLMDVARALAAILVTVSHVRDLLIENYSGQGGLLRVFYFFTGLGHAAVIVFFVLSGFWITKSVVGRAHDKGFWASYLIARLSRLWLVLIPALLLGGVLDWIGSDLLRSQIYQGTSGASSLTWSIRLSLPVLAGNMLFLQTIFAPVFGSNGPLWSLASEFWFYIWFPALWLTIVLRRPSVLLLSLVLGFLQPVLFIGFVSWLCGSFLYWLVERAKLRVVRPDFAMLILLTGAAITVAMLVVIRVYPTWWIDPLLALSFAWLLFGLCLVNPAVPWARGLAAYGAKRSFSLYVIHYPIAALAAAYFAAFNRLAPTPEALALVLALVAFIIAVSFGFAYLTENHTAQLRRWLSGRIGGGRRQVTSGGSSFSETRADELN